MAPKKAPAAKAAAKDEKPKKQEVSAELKAIKEKEKAIAKVEPPSREEKDAAEAKIQTVIDGLQDKVKKLTSEINEKSHGKEEHFRMKEEIKAKLDEYSAKIDELQKAKDREIGGIQEKQNESKNRRQELNKMKKNLGFDDIKAIDEKIRELEFRMQTESLSLKQEKELMIKIKELKASRPLVTKYEKMEQSMGPANVDAARMSVDEIKKQISEVRDAKSLQQQALGKLIEARKKVMGDVPELYEKRDGIRAQINEKYSELKEMRDKFRAEQNAFNQYLQEVRVIRNERYAIERKERAEQYEQRRNEPAPDAAGAGDALMSDVPFLSDLTYLDNLTNYLEGLKPKEEEKKETVAELEIKAGKGETVLLCKGAREEEFFFAPTKKKQLKKKGEGKAKALKHDMTTLGFFSQYKITPPVDTAGIGKALEEVNAKIAEFKAKQVKKIEDDKKKKEKGDKGEADETSPKAEEAKEEA